LRSYKTIIWPVVLYWCETWSLTLREHRLRVFERRVLDFVKVISREAKEKRLLGRPSHRWLGNTKVDIDKMGWCGLI
jgi:hypothetical protein